jgi:SSS family solute:Na+ symporter
MARWQLITCIIVLYLAVTLGIGLRAGKKASKSVTGYVAGDRSFGLLVMYFIFGATMFSAFAFLGGPGWAYSRGAAAFYILSYGILGMAPWYWVGPRAARVGRAYGYVTQAQLLVGRFPSRFLTALMALLTVLAFVPYVTLQMRGAGIVIEAVTDGNIPLWVGAGVAYGIVLLYVLTSGVAAVGWTNTFQGIVMLVIAWTLGIYLPMRLYGGVGPMFQEISAQRPELLTAPGLTATGEEWSWGGYSTAILVSAIGVSMWPHLFMKAFTARDDNTIRRTVVLFPTFQLFLIPVFIIGFAGVLFPESPSEPDFILPFLILRSDLPALVVGLFCAGALSASMSTGDALLHAGASVAVEDGVRPFLGLDDRQQRILMRAVVLVMGGVAYFFALYEGISLVVLLLSAYGIIAQFTPPLISALYWKRATTPGVVSGLLVGSAVTLFFFFNGELRPLDLHEGILGLLVHVPVLVGVSFLTRDRDEDRAEAFLAAARGSSGGQP